MSKIYSFFGRMVNTFYGSTGNITLAALMFVLMLKLLMIMVSNKYYKAPKMAEALNPKIKELDKKYAKNQEKRAKAVSELLLKNQYPTFGFILYYAFMMFIVFSVSMAVNTPMVYITEGAETAVNFLFVPDITKFTFRAIQEIFPDFNAVRYMAFPVVALVLQFSLDTYMSDNFLVERRWWDYVALGITLIACIALPAVFAVIWSAYEATNWIQVLLVNRKGAQVKLEELKLPDDWDDEPKNKKKKK